MFFSYFAKYNDSHGILTMHPFCNTVDAHRRCSVDIFIIFSDSDDTRNVSEMQQISTAVVNSAQQYTLIERTSGIAAIGMFTELHQTG